MKKWFLTCDSSCLTDEEAAFALSEGGGGGTAVLAMKESRSFSWYTAARPGSSRPPGEDESPMPARSGSGKKIVYVHHKTKFPKKP